MSNAPAEWRNAKRRRANFEISAFRLLLGPQPPLPKQQTYAYKRAGKYLHEIAQESGGRYFRGDTMLGITSAFAQVAEELRRQYSIGYYPTPVGQAGQRREIKVRVSQPDLVVKARDSYVYWQKTTNDKESNGQQPSGTSPPAKHLSGSL